jgi:phage shock protein A
MSAPEPFLDRVLRIFRQKAVAKMNELDDPAEAIDTVIADQLDSINAARADLAAVATAQKRLEMMADEFAQRAARHIAEAQTAHAEGNDAGARTSMRRGLETERLAEEARGQLRDVEAQRAELERLLDRMRANYDRLRLRRESVAAQAAAARATAKGNESLTALGDGATVERELERARLSLADLRARADATSQLRESGALDMVGPGEFDSRPLVSDAEVEQRLAQLSK